MRQTAALLILVVGTVYGYHVLMSDLMRRQQAEEMWEPGAMMTSLMDPTLDVFADGGPPYAEAEPPEEESDKTSFSDSVPGVAHIDD